MVCVQYIIIIHIGFNVLWSAKWSTLDNAVCQYITKPVQQYFKFWRIPYTPISHPVSLWKKLDLFYKVPFWFCNCQTLLPCSLFTSNLKRYDLTNSTAQLRSLIIKWQLWAVLLSQTSCLLYSNSSKNIKKNKINKNLAQF